MSKRSIVGLGGVVDEEYYDQFDDPEGDANIQERVNKGKKTQYGCPGVRSSRNEGDVYTWKRKFVVHHTLVED